MAKAKKPSVNPLSPDAFSMIDPLMFNGSELIVGIAAIADYCKVDKDKVAEWIGAKDVFPAYWAPKIAQHCISKLDLDEWIKAGFKGVSRKSFPKEVSTDIICTFREFEIGKNCMSATSFRTPLVWKPQIDVILREFKQFENNMSNFWRCAVFNLINDLTQLLLVNGHEASPQTKIMMASSKITEKSNINNRMLRDIKDALSCLRKSRNIDQIKDFIKMADAQVELLEHPWDKKARVLFKQAHALMLSVEAQIKSGIDEDYSSWEDEEEVDD